MQVKTTAVKKVSLCKHITVHDDRRVFVVGDLDGDLLRLQLQLGKVSFDPKSDVLISLGDIIDRGEDSFRLIEFLQETGAYVVLGNHEHMMMEAILSRDACAMRLWVQNGGKWHFNVSEIHYLIDMCKWFSQQQLSILLQYRGRKIGISHTLPPYWDWDHVPKSTESCVFPLLWDRERFTKRLHEKNLGVDFSIHGHNSTEQPLWIGNSLHIDTAFYGMPTVVELSDVIASYSAGSTVINV